MRRLTAIFLGGLGLVAGIATAVSGATWLGVAAGLAAIAAGIVGFGNAADSDDLEADATTARNERSQAQAEIARLQQQLVEAQAKHAAAERMIDELSSQSAGSLTAKLDSTAPVVPAGSPDLADTRLLADPETNLFSEAYFRVALDARIASARRHLRPVAVALVKVLEGNDAEAGDDADPQKVTGAIRQTLRDADTACRMTDGSYAIILEDTPENGAVWTVERVRRNLTSRYGHHTMWAGVACYPAHAFSSEELLDQAAVALTAAREWKQDRIEVATSE